MDEVKRPDPLGRALRLFEQGSVRFSAHLLNDAPGRYKPSLAEIGHVMRTARREPGRDRYDERYGWSYSVYGNESCSDYPVHVAFAFRSDDEGREVVVIVTAHRDRKRRT